MIEMKYEGDIDSAVATILTKLGTIISSDADAKRSRSTKLATNLLDDVVEQFLPWEGRIRARLTEIQYKGDTE